MTRNRYLEALKWSTIFIGVGVLLVAAIANAQPTGFVTRQESGQVVIVDLSNGTALGTIPTLGSSPGEIAISPDASTLYVTQQGTYEDENAVDILDVAGASPLQSVVVGSVPIELALLPDGSKLYTADFLGGTVSVINTITRSKVASIPTNSLSYDVAAAPDGTMVYATALLATVLFVIDTANDTVVDTIPIGRNFMGHIAITPNGQKAYVTEFRNQVNVIDLLSRTVIGSIPFNSGEANPNNGALDIAIDPQGRFAYVLGFDTVNVIDLTTDTLIATIPIGIQLSDVAIDSTGAFVYVTTLYQDAELVPLNEIVKIETNGFTIQERFLVGGLLVGLAVGPSSIQVAIDIKPGSDPNSINLKSKGVVAVAILTTPEFDSSTVDPASVVFADASPIKWAIEDVDHDGDMDMLLHFKTQELKLEENSFKATLTGMTDDGGTIVGTDSIRIVRRGPPPACTLPPAGLTGWWPGDGNTDDVIGGQNAELWGDATTGLGFVGEAFILDGDGDFVNVPDGSALNVGTGEFTVGLWAFFNDTAGEQVLAEKYIQGGEQGPSKGWTLTKLENNVLGFGTFSEEEGAAIDTPAPLPIAPFTWYHFAATRQAGILTTYMNGLPVAIVEDAPLVNADSESSLKFGHRGDPYDTPGSEDDRGFYLNGGIDEAQIFVGRALTADQIRAIFAAGRAGICKEQY